MGRWTAATVAALAFALAAPGAAAAQDGVTVDPESPAGQEYAIPLDEARKDAGTRARATPAATAAATAVPTVQAPRTGGDPGLDRDCGARRAGAAPQAPRRAAHPKPSATSRPAASERATPAPEQAAVLREASADTGGTSPAVAFLGGGALVLLLGGALGLALRRRRD